MKLLGIGIVFLLALTACNADDTAKQLNRDNNINTTDKSNNGKTGVGQEYGGKGTGYGQVKKIEPGQAVPPTAEVPNKNAVPPTAEVPNENAVPPTAEVPNENAVPPTAEVPNENAVPPTAEVP